MLHSSRPLALMHQLTGSLLVAKLWLGACLTDAKPLPGWMFNIDESLSIWPLGTNFNLIWTKIVFLKKMHLKISSAKQLPFWSIPNVLTHCGLVTPYDDMDLGEWFGTGNNLLPDGTKPLPKRMLTYHQWGSLADTWDQLHRKWPRYQLIKWVWKIQL